MMRAATADNRSTCPSTCQATWQLLTPNTAGGAAIAIIQITGHIDAALQAVAQSALPVGSFQVRNLAGIDRAVMARWSNTCLHLMPHGGIAVLDALGQWLTQAGIIKAANTLSMADLRHAYAEASSEVHALMLWTLSLAASPAAVDLLLAQPALWEHREWSQSRTYEESHRDQTLKHLIHPSLVVIVGEPNVGKSRLLNALAGQNVSIVSDLAGTTRDHVGVLALCDDVAVRLVDTPGARFTTDAIEAHALAISHRLIQQADLVLSCSDAEHPFLDGLALPAASRVLRIGTKFDICGNHPQADLTVSAATGHNMQDLAHLISQTLVPSTLRQAPVPWRFWDDFNDEIAAQTC
jgi:hypothetical protein